MAVDPAAFVKWRYQQVLFSQPPWQSYRLFSSATDPCVLLTVLATDHPPPPQPSRDSYSFSLPLFLFASLLRSFFLHAACHNKRQRGWSLELGADGSMGINPPPPPANTPTHTPFQSHSTHSHQSVRLSEKYPDIIQSLSCVYLSI